MNPAPLLLTLYGENDPRLGWIEAVVAAAITNIVSDISGVIKGTEDKKTAILNTLFPFIGKAIGSAVWPVKPQTVNTTGPAAGTPGKLADLPPEIQQAVAIIGSGVPFISSLIFQVSKGYRI